MAKLPWQHGQLAPLQGPMVVSATRFTYKSLWDMPGVYWNGLRLRRAWPRFPGSIGVSIAADVSRRSTYTVSLWRSEEDLRRFVSHPEHLAMVRAYRPRMESSSAATWTVERFDLGAAWRKARQMLTQMPQSSSTKEPSHAQS
jgi:heme-degrading monooxygenase HmoA